MDALIKDESMDFATLNFEKAEKIPEIPPIFMVNDVFSPCETGFLWENSRHLHTQIAKRQSPQSTVGLTRT